MRRRSFAVDWDHCLGAGGEGEVYLGRCLETGEPFAIKVSVSLDPRSAREQLAAEVDCCRRAAGDGTVTLVAANLDAERPFLVFELAQAGTLLDEMRGLRERGRTYHPRRALERVRAILVALGQVHERGLVHRDVKPANLLRFGHALKLGDFGAGTSTDGPEASEDAPFTGTRRYAAPEQRWGAAPDVRADLFSVGCILHEMLTGKAPQPGRQRARDTQALILPELDALLDSLLDARVANRPSSAREAIERLDAVLARYAYARTEWQRRGLGPSPY